MLKNYSLHLWQYMEGLWYGKCVQPYIILLIKIYVYIYIYFFFFINKHLHATACSSRRGMVIEQ